MITVFEKPNCAHCKTVKAQLTNLGLEFKTAPINDDVLALARERGWMQAPIVVDSEHKELSFSGNDWLALEAMAKANGA